jgi:hypothetical protein
MDKNSEREVRLRKRIAELLRLFEAYQVIVDDSPVQNVQIHPVKGTGENSVVTLSWREMGMDFTYQITEEGLANAEIGSDNVWVIEDHEGEDFSIEFTTPDGKRVGLPDESKGTPP